MTNAFTPTFLAAMAAAIPPHQAPASTPEPIVQAVRANPWRRFSVAFPPTSDATEALRRSGLDWQVDKVGLRTDDLQPVPDAFAIRRADTQRVLGVVGADFTPLQNAEAFAFFRQLAGNGRLTFETAGAFRQGAITWVQARLPDLDIRLGDDEAKAYLLISNGHTGNRMLTVAPTTIRVICENSLAMAQQQTAEQRRHRPGLATGFQVRHTAGMRVALDDIAQAYAQTRTAHAVTREAWEFLARKPLTTRMTRLFFNRVWGAAGPDEADRAAALRKAREARLEAILASPTSQVRGTKDTAFSLLQAAVEHIDHERLTRTVDGVDPQEQRLISATFGSGAALKETAWTAMLDLVAA